MQSDTDSDEEFSDCVNQRNTMSQYFTIEPPTVFDFHTPAEWTKWIRRFERFRVAPGLISKEEKEQVNMLVYTMGEKADDIFVSFKLSEKQAVEYKAVVDKFTAHFIPKINVIFERSKFNMRVQEKGESVEEYITALHKLAETCDYEKFEIGMQDELIRGRLVIGLLDKKVNQKLQLEENLTLERAVQVARQSEDIETSKTSNRQSLVYNFSDVSQQNNV